MLTSVGVYNCMSETVILQTITIGSFHFTVSPLSMAFRYSDPIGDGRITVEMIRSCLESQLGGSRALAIFSNEVSQLSSIAQFVIAESILRFC